ncbi:glycosyltransferase [Pollutibacter soli]|uniref:glycosyltransferase n=1 Tax=Pollutibacter soli TaxID=3034157 RepID=UPI0030133187
MQQQKKIVIIGPAYPLRGGLASYDERLAREFTAHGYESTIYTFSLQYPGFLFPGTSQYSSEPPPPDLTIKVVINSINPVNWIMTGNELKAFKPDIIVVRYWLPFMGPCLGTILRQVRGNRFTRIICIADNINPHEKRPGDKIFTRYFVKPVDAFITMSKKVMNDLLKVTRSQPAEFVPHPLYDNFGEAVSKSIARKALDLPNDGSRIILFFGFIRAYKGLDLLLKAMAEPGIINAGIKLLIAGEFYDDRKIYLDLIKELGISDEVILRTDFIPDSQVRFYLCAADLVVQPYKNATQSGVTPLAYHFEKPMVVTNTGALPDMVPHEKVGLVAEPDAESIAKQILRFYELGEDFFLPHLREEKKKYAWSQMVKAIEDLAYGIQK